MVRLYFLTPDKGIYHFLTSDKGTYHFKVLPLWVHGAKGVGGGRRGKKTLPSPRTETNMTFLPLLFVIT